MPIYATQMPVHLENARKDVDLFETTIAHIPEASLLILFWKHITLLIALLHFDLLSNYESWTGSKLVLIPDLILLKN